jgi:hypothetical protein
LLDRGGKRTRDLWPTVVKQNFITDWTICELTKLKYGDMDFRARNSKIGANTIFLNKTGNNWHFMLATLPEIWDILLPL